MHIQLVRPIVQAASTQLQALDGQWPSLVLHRKLYTEATPGQQMFVLQLRTLTNKLVTLKPPPVPTALVNCIPTGDLPPVRTLLAATMKGPAAIADQWDLLIPPLASAVQVRLVPPLEKVAEVVARLFDSPRDIARHGWLNLVVNVGRVGHFTPNDSQSLGEIFPADTVSQILAAQTPIPGPLPNPPNTWRTRPSLL